ncbi:hypothetical protein WDU94_014725 [Cyamophila willieti]
MQWYYCFYLLTVLLRTPWSNAYEKLRNISYTTSSYYRHQYQDGWRLGHEIYNKLSLANLHQPLYNEYENSTDLLRLQTREYVQDPLTSLPLSESKTTFPLTEALYDEHNQSIGWKINVVNQHKPVLLTILVGIKSDSFSKNNDGEAEIKCMPGLDQEMKDKLLSMSIRGQNEIANSSLHIGSYSDQNAIDNCETESQSCNRVEYLENSPKHMHDEFQKNKHGTIKGRNRFRKKYFNLEIAGASDAYTSLPSECYARNLVSEDDGNYYNGHRRMSWSDKNTVSGDVQRKQHLGKRKAWNADESCPKESTQCAPKQRTPKDCVTEFILTTSCVENNANSELEFQKDKKNPHDMLIPRRKSHRYLTERLSKEKLNRNKLLHQNDLVLNQELIRAVKEKVMDRFDKRS